MNSEEKIFHYLSGNISDEQKKYFEKQLEKSDSFRNEFERIKSELDNLKESEKSILLDERYFAGLFPRVRERIEKKDKSRRIKTVSYSFASAMAAAVIFFIFISPFKNEIDFSIEEYRVQLSDSAVYSENIIMPSIVDEYSSINYNGTAAEYANDEIFQNLNEQFSQSVSYLSANNYLDYSDSYDYIELLSDEEFNELYNELVTKTIL